MDRVGEIHRRGAVGQVLHIPVRGKAVDVLRKQSRSPFNRLKNSLLSDISLCHSRIWRSQLSFASWDAMLFAASAPSLYFQWAAIPYSAVLCISSRTDLDLKGLAGGAHQRRVKRLVHIRLRHGDVIFKTPRDRGVHLMDHAQSRIAVFHPNPQ